MFQAARTAQPRRFLGSIRLNAVPFAPFTVDRVRVDRLAFDDWWRLLSVGSDSIEILDGSR